MPIAFGLEVFLVNLTNERTDSIEMRLIEAQEKLKSLEQIQEVNYVVTKDIFWHIGVGMVTFTLSAIIICCGWTCYKYSCIAKIQFLLTSPIPPGRPTTERHARVSFQMDKTDPQEQYALQPLRKSASQLSINKPHTSKILQN